MPSLGTAKVALLLIVIGIEVCFSGESSIGEQPVQSDSLWCDKAQAAVVSGCDAFGPESSQCTELQRGAMDCATQDRGEAEGENDLARALVKATRTRRRKSRRKALNKGTRTGTSRKRVESKASGNAEFISGYSAGLKIRSKDAPEKMVLTTWEKKMSCSFRGR